MRELDDFKDLGAWDRLRTKFYQEKEVILWCWSKGNDNLLRVWLPVVIYAPFTPLSLQKKLTKMLDCDRLLMLSRTIINDNPDFVRKFINQGFGVVCCSDKAPRPLEV